MGSGNWIVDNLNSALGTWNGKLAEIWTLLSTGPEEFKGGGVWTVIVGINDGLKAIGYALLVIFFVMGVVKTCGSFTELRKPEQVLKCFVRFALAQAAVSHGMELMTALFTVGQGMVNTIMGASGLSALTDTTLPDEMVDIIEDVSFLDSIVGSGKLSAKEKSIIDRCTAGVYHDYIRSGYRGAAPTLKDFHAELLRQTEAEARDVALAIELFTEGSLNTFAKPSNVDTNSRILCYDIRDLGKQLLPVGMLVVLDSIFNRVIRNRKLGKNTWVYVDEIYLLFQHEYSANFLFTLWKRVRKYGACCTGITQNLDDLLQSHTARTMLANSEFLVMLNQAATDRAELAQLLNISDNQLSYITNVDSGRGLIKCGSTIVPFMNTFPKNTRLYKLMSTKFMEQIDAT